MTRRPRATRCGNIRIAAATPLLLAGLLACLPASAGGHPGSRTPDPGWTEVDLSRHFDAFGADGAFLLLDRESGELRVHNPARARTGFLPASTFKILNSLIALETGVLADEHEIIRWDGVDRGDWWNGDQAMTRAFQRSTVWFYQEVARRVGEDRMRYWVERAGYGNRNIGGGIDRFWLEGEMRITPEQQVRLVDALLSGELPFSARSQEIVRRVMRMEEGGGFTLNGKTGWARHQGINYGWLVGWVERNGKEYVFATQIESPAADFPMRDAQQQITRAALNELGILP